MEITMSTHPEDGNRSNKLKFFTALLCIASLLTIQVSGCADRKRKDFSPSQVIHSFFSSINRGSANTALSYWSINNKRQRKFYSSLIEKWIKEKKSFKINETAYYNDKRFNDSEKALNKNVKLVAYNLSNNEIFTLEKKQNDWKITAFLNIKGSFKDGSLIFNTSPENARGYQDFISNRVAFIKNNRPEESYKVVNKKLITYQEFIGYSNQIKKIEFRAIYFIGSPSDSPNDGNLVRVGNENQKIDMYFSDNKINKIALKMD